MHATASLLRKLKKEVEKIKQAWTPTPAIPLLLSIIQFSAVKSK